MDRRTRYLHGIDRARQALAEWRRGELQWQVPRRVSEPRMVSFARRSEGTDRRMATPLQRGAPSFEPRLPHAQRVRDWQDQRPVMQRAGTLRYVGPPRPGPLLNRPLGDKCSNPGKPSQANRGPKNRGRSRVTGQTLDRL